MDRPSPAWWINFRVIEEGSWGSRGGVLTFLDLLEHGASHFAAGARRRDPHRARRQVREIAGS